MSTQEPRNEIQIGSNIGELLTEEQLCQLLNIGETTAWKLRDSGEIKFCRVARQVLYLKEDVIEYLKRQRNG